MIRKHNDGIDRKWTFAECAAKAPPHAEQTPDGAPRGAPKLQVAPIGAPSPPRVRGRKSEEASGAKTRRENEKGRPMQSTDNPTPTNDDHQRVPKQALRWLA